jgi:hypothetical protein
MMAGSPAASWSARPCNAPLGYAVTDRKLAIVPEEAEAVRLIFRRYLHLGSVRRLQQDLDRQGIRSKDSTGLPRAVRRSMSTGEDLGTALAGLGCPSA